MEQRQRRSTGSTRRDALKLLGVAASMPLLPRLTLAGTDDAERLRKLIEASEIAASRLDPMPRKGRAPGDPVFIDPLSDAYFDAVRGNAEKDVAGLRDIDPARLGAVDRIAYDVFRFQAERQLDRFRSGRWVIQRRVPLNATSGLHVQLPDYQASTPFNTIADYEAGLERASGFAGYLDSLAMRLKEGRAADHVHSRLVTEMVIGQVEAFAALPTEKSPLYAPILRMPESIDASNRARLEREYRAAVESRVTPAYVRLRNYLRDDYLPGATEAPGRWAMKDGLALYAAELAHHTTLAATADDLHATGLAEVERYRANMEQVRREVRFDGDLAAFFEHIRSDRQYYFTRAEDLIARFEEIEARIWQGIPKLFAQRPRAPFEVRALPGVGGQRGTGYYRPGPPDGVSPGVLFFNMEMLNTRPIPTMETLTLHEGIPGHHFQITLALEDTSLPAILRYGSITAYGEGWGLYAESLGRELGMFTDPYQWFGHLDMGMLRAVRLVVDTGLHAKQWTRQRAIDYMLANTSMAPRDVAVEIDRYLSWPGQACAYKPGELKIRELRERAAKALGSRFDVRDFHAQVLNTGALPLAVLDEKVGRWIAAATRAA